MLILFLLKGLFHREEKIGEHQKKKKRKFKVDEHLISDITILLHRNSQFEFLILHSKVFEHLKKIEFNFTAISYYRSRIDPDVHIFKINPYFII